MTGHNKPRLSQARQTLEKLAVLEVMVDNLTQAVHKLTRHLEGNGKPGLLERTAQMESRLTDVEATLDATVKNLADASSSLSTLAETVRHHQDPRNLQHKTLARQWAEDPKALFKTAGAVLVALYLLGEAGVLRALGAWLAGLR